MSLFTSDIQENYDPIYKHLATLEQHAGQVPESLLQGKILCRQKVCKLWEKHKYKLDGNKSQKEIRVHFNSVYWELYLCEFLASIGFIFGNRIRTGPDFKCTHPVTDGDFYFEAISVKAGEGHNSAQMIFTNVSELKDGQSIPFTSYSADPLKLRIIQGIKEKANKFKEYLNNGIVTNKDFLIIAVHYSGEMGFLSGSSGLSVFHESVFPLGPITIAFDTQTHKPIETYSAFSPSIFKHNGAQVDTGFFLSEASNHISGLLFSDITYTRDEEVDSSLGFIHNPMAKNPLPKGLFENIKYNEWEIIRSEDEKWWEFKKI